MTFRRRVIFHVGQTKAGSSSIQNYLEAERHALLERGWLFPESVMLRHNPYDKNRTPGHLKLLSFLKNKNLSKFEAELDANPTAKVLISIENLFSDQPDDVLSLLGEYFENWDVEIVSVLRPQLTWLRSRYIENVLSGFRSSTETFHTFVRNSVNSGTLDYNGRLDHLRRMLRARKVTALRIEGGTQPMLPHFLTALGIPETDSVHAKNAHYNRRENEAFLVEAKRRLNSLIKRLTVVERLKLEHEMRQRAQQMIAEAGFLSDSQFTMRVPISETEMATLQSGNDSLLESGVLDGRLKCGRQEESDVVLDPEVEVATRRLFSYGIDLAASIAADAHDPERFLQSPLNLHPAVIMELSLALAKHPYSLHLDAPESATLSACETGRLVTLMLSPGAKAYNLFAELDSIETASPFVSLLANVEQSTDMPAALDVLGLPHPGVIVFGNGVSTETVGSVLRQMNPRVAMLLGKVGEAFIEYPFSDYRALPLCDCLFLFSVTQ